MAIDVANLLLRITGDSRDAQQALVTLAAKLQAIDNEGADVTVDVDSAAAEGQLAVLSTEFAAIDGRHLNVTVDIDRDGFAATTIGNLTTALTDFVGETTKVGGAAASAGAGASNLGFSVAGLTGQLGLLTAAAGAAAVGIGTALVLGLVALAASAAAAVIGIGGLAIAFGGALIPALVLAAVGFSDFTEQAKIAGTAAHAVSTAMTAIKNALAPAANTFMTGLAAGLQALVPLVQSLTPSFQMLGAAMGTTFQQFAAALVAMGPQFALLIQQATLLGGPLLQGFVALAQIFTNLAVAIMPLLVQFLGQVATWLTNLAAQTGNIGGLQTLFAQLVDATQQWLQFGGALAAMFLPFITALLPVGNQLLQWLTGVVQQATAWLRTTAGQETLRRIFAAIVPLVRSILTFIGRVATLFVQSAPAWAPIIQGVFDAFNTWLSGIQSVINALSEVYNWLARIRGENTLGTVTGPGNLNPNATTIGGAVMMAGGGLFTAPAFAMVGEGRHREAVLPLSNRVMGGLAGMLADRMTVAPAFGGDQHFHANISVPGGGSPDARVTAALLTREWKKRA